MYVTFYAQGRFTYRGLSKDFFKGLGYHLLVLFAAASVNAPRGAINLVTRVLSSWPTRPRNNLFICAHVDWSLAKNKRKLLMLSVTFILIVHTSSGNFVAQMFHPLLLHWKAILQTGIYGGMEKPDTISFRGKISILKLVQ
jgi:hypothetical protein